MKFARLFTLALLILGGGMTTALAEKRVALVIGNSAYGSQPLSNPANDAALMSKTLRKVGFEVIEHIDADRRTMRRSLREFSRALSEGGEDAIGLFYYAGHGIQANGENYMIPVDAQIQDSLDVEFEGVRTADLLSGLEHAGNNLNIVVLDACRNNPYRAATRSGGAGLARMDAPSGTFIAYSTAPGKVAADGRGTNSPYTRALARAISTPGEKVEDVFKSVRVAVIDRTNGEQVPWESSSLTGDFFFVDEPIVRQPVAEPEPVVPDNTVEITFWNSIKDADSPALFESYLQQYPTGLFAALAKTKIDLINSEQAKQGDLRDQTFFQAIQNSTYKADFEAYLAQYPNGIFAGLAKARIAAIEAEEQQEKMQTEVKAPDPQPAQDPDADFWNAIKDANSVAEFQAYLDQFPDGKFSNLAKAKIAGLEESRKVAALTPASGHPMDGTWRLTWKVIGRYFPSMPFCASGEQGEYNLSVRDGKFDETISSNLGRTARVSGDFSDDGVLDFVYRGSGWSQKGRLRIVVSDDKAEKSERRNWCHARMSLERVAE